MIKRSAMSLLKKGFNCGVSGELTSLRLGSHPVKPPPPQPASLEEWKEERLRGLESLETRNESTPLAPRLAFSA